MISTNSRSRSLSLDKLVEWPAQLSLVGKFAGKDILDVGCGSAEKSRYFAVHGAANVMALDSSLALRHCWLAQRPIRNCSTVVGDMNHLELVPELQERRFDLIVSFGTLMYAENLHSVLREISRRLKPGGAVVCSVPHPFRFVALKRERHDLEYGRAYCHTGLFTYPSMWNPAGTLSHRLPRVSDYLNALTEAGLVLEKVEEPKVTDRLRAIAPEKAAWMERYFGILLFRARR
jgi:SAM-dependent methyltransferase